MLNNHFSKSLKQLRSAIKSGKKVYGIFGSPILHSLSPLMHNEVFKLKNLDALFLSFKVDKIELKEALAIVKNEGISGLSITLPLKENIIDLLDNLTPDAKRIGSVNTIDFKNKKLKGFNTDLQGFLNPLLKYIEPIKYESVAVFGSGGAARTVLYALLRNGIFPAIRLISRNAETSNRLLDEAEGWKKHPTMLEWVNFDDLSHYSEAIWESRLVINCTPLGMKGFSGEFPATLSRFFRPGQVAYDLIYSPLRTSFLVEAEKRGALILSGLDMLVGQGAKAFRIWTGKVMPQEKIKDLLATKLSGTN